MVLVKILTIDCVILNFREEASAHFLLMLTLLSPLCLMQTYRFWFQFFHSPQIQIVLDSGLKVKALTSLPTASLIYPVLVRFIESAQRGRPQSRAEWGNRKQHAGWLFGEKNWKLEGCFLWNSSETTFPRAVNRGCKVLWPDRITFK